MKNSSDPLTPLVDAGLELRLVDGGRLSVVPAARLTDPLRQHIRAHKHELMAMLATNDTHHRSVAIEFHFRDGGGGILIDHDGFESAVLDITERWGDRIDLPDLIATLQGMDQAAQVEATKLIEKLQGSTAR